MKKSFLFISLLMPQFLLAWGPMGHRIVAEVAYHYLSPEACREVDETLGTHGLVYWANWPDEIKSDDQIYPASYDWHIQDLPSNLTDEQLWSMRNHYPEHGGRLWTTMDQLMAQLPGHQEYCTINNVNMPYRDALVFLIHLTADATCPVHMAHEEDRGGNDVKMKWFGEPTNMHKVWDEQIIFSRGYSYTEYAQMLVDTYASEVDSILAWQEQDYLRLVYQTTQDIYTCQSAGELDTYHYLWKWKTTCDHLLFIAGIRLANNLTSIR